MISPMAKAIREATVDQILQVGDTLAHLAAQGGRRAVTWRALRSALLHQEEGRDTHGMPHSDTVKAVAAMTSSEHDEWLRELADLGRRATDPGQRALLMSLYYEVLGAMQVVQYKARALDEDAQRLLEDGQQE